MNEIRAIRTPVHGPVLFFRVVISFLLTNILRLCTGAAPDKLVGVSRKVGTAVFGPWADLIELALLYSASIQMSRI
jgi:hypothetical protein